MEAVTKWSRQLHARAVFALNGIASRTTNKDNGDQGLFFYQVVAPDTERLDKDNPSVFVCGGTAESLEMEYTRNLSQGS